MRKIYKIITFTLLFAFLFISPLSVYATSQDSYVYDRAELLSSQEFESLERICEQYFTENQVNIIIMTANGIGNETRKTYLENFYDDNSLEDASLILINMDSENRGVEIQGYGKCEFNLSDDRIESVLDDIRPMLSDGNYYEALLEFTSQVDYYMSIDATTDYQHTQQDNENYNENYYDDSHRNEDSLFYNIGIQALMAIGVGAVVVLFMALRSGGRVTVNQTTYLDQGNSKILAKRDRYIRTATTKRKKPEDNSSSGGHSGGGGVSSGGSSHSGGGRSF